MMDELLALRPLENGREQAVARLLERGSVTLPLTAEEAAGLLERRDQALRDTRRVEFGPGVLEKLMTAFRDSPYLDPACWAETLAGLQDLFYEYKNQCMDALSDDELIAAMRRLYDGEAGGSLDYLGGTALEELCRRLRSGESWEDEDEN